MPTAPTYPGVYIEEVPSGARAIVGAATSITAFVGRAPRGPVNEPKRVASFGEYARTFGPITADSTMSYAVNHYFLNGGSDAIIVRVVNDTGADAAAEAKLVLPVDGDPGGLTIEAANPGTWGNRLRADVDYDVDPDLGDRVFNLTIREVMVRADGEVEDLYVEKFANVSTDENSPRFVTKVLEAQSELARVDGAVPEDRPNATGETPVQVSQQGSDGPAIGFDQVAAGALENPKKGIFALRKVDIFNLLCIPPFTRTTDVDGSTWAAANAFCVKKRAMLIVDPPSAWTDKDKAVAGADNLAASPLGLTPSANAALFFPRVKMADPRQENRLDTFVPCGVVAGVFARTDAQRGVWKAPAGLDASLVGVRELAVKLTDNENGPLNPIAVNCLRAFKSGIVNWGARTLKGADRLASEWKYIPIRRLALFIEESLYRGTQWVVFEPNDEPLWSQIRMSLGTFMQDLFRQGAFQGSSPRDAYFVKCDKETTTQSDRDKGIVNIEVGFAPLKPAEFVIIRISQIAGER